MTYGELTSLIDGILDGVELGDLRSPSPADKKRFEKLDDYQYALLVRYLSDEPFEEPSLVPTAPTGADKYFKKRSEEWANEEVEPDLSFMDEEDVHVANARVAEGVTLL